MEEPVKRARAPAMDVRDRLSGLPDELLHCVLSFLPARDAVRTCVLAPRWRHLWPSARHLNIDSMGFATVEGFTRFVTNLLIRRGHVPLDEFKLCAVGSHISLNDFTQTADLWIYYALRCCNVQELAIVDRNENHDFYYPDRYSFTSSHLKILHLRSVGVTHHFIKHLFSGCPLLEDLVMLNCDITATQFSSTTLKFLCISYVGYSSVTKKYVDIVIDMPRLVTLFIGPLVSTKSSFMNLESLLTATVFIAHPRFTLSFGCYILHAFSNVRDLQLLAFCPVLGEKILDNDMLFYQVVFTNLTTLSLGDWCLHHSCKALLYVLKQSPNLEKLTLMLMHHTTKKIGPPCEGTATPFHCKKLQKIEIICPESDERVSAVVAILWANLISIPEINIKPSS